MIMMKKIRKSNLIRLPINKTIKIHRAIILVRAVFHESKKCHPQVFLDKRLYELQII